MDNADVVVIGAGVVGLAVARALAAQRREVLVLEAAARPGSGASSRNSEVIHAGIYYPPGSLKARLCVAGREQLYDYCAQRGIAHRPCGKLIVAATPAELPALERIAVNAAANGVALEPLERQRACGLEPQLQCTAALHSSRTGIVDSGAYLLALLADAERDGAQLACRSRVTRLVPGASGIDIGIEAAEPALRARLLVNCAGVDAPAVARLIEGFPPSQVPRAWRSKGNYFELAGRAPFTRLIYPLPEPGGLGVHLTLDLAGRARFGPDVEDLGSGDGAVDLAVDARRGAAFYGAIRRYWPGLPDEALRPAYAGQRARIGAPGEPAADFRIEGPASHGCDGVINLFGIESPGLTASLAIADEVARLAS